MERERVWNNRFLIERKSLYDAVVVMCRVLTLLACDGFLTWQAVSVRQTRVEESFRGRCTQTLPCWWSSRYSSMTPWFHSGSRCWRRWQRSCLSVQTFAESQRGWLACRHLLSRWVWEDHQFPCYSVMLTQLMSTLVIYGMSRWMRREWNDDKRINWD